MEVVGFAFFEPPVGVLGLVSEGYGGFNCVVGSLLSGGGVFPFYFFWVRFLFVQACCGFYPEGVVCFFAGQFSDVEAGVP